MRLPILIVLILFIFLFPIDSSSNTEELMVFLVKASIAILVTGLAFSQEIEQWKNRTLRDETDEEDLVTYELPKEKTIDDKPIKTRKQAKISKVEHPTLAAPLHFCVNYEDIFKSYDFRYDSERSISSIFRTIIETCEMTQPPVVLKKASYARGLTVNNFQFSIVPQTKIYRGQETETLPKVSVIGSKLDDITRALGREAGLIFHPSVAGTNGHVAWTVPAQTINTAGLGNALGHLSFTEMLSNRNKFDQLLNVPIAVGYDVKGGLTVLNLPEAPHVVVAGETGSGKSGGLNSYICAMTSVHTPETLILDMVDLKKVELSFYKRLPHLSANGIITELDTALELIEFYVSELNERTEILEKAKVENIQSFNKKIRSADGFMPFRVLIIDELASLVLDAQSRKEDSNDRLISGLAKISSMGRACGLILLLCTQRPEKKLLSGLFLSNIPTRVAFKVGDGSNSQIILDTTGAETLGGKGDGLFKTPGQSGLVRFQGIFVDKPEIEAHVRELRKVHKKA